MILSNSWTGGGASGNWSDNNNWGGAQPVYGTLTFSGSTRTTNSDDNITAMNILLWTGTSAWTLNQGGSTVLSLFDNGGGQAKIENQSTGLVTINLPITFAANNGSPPNPFGEINAVNGDITFGTGTLTVNGSSVNGIKLFGSNHTTTFNNTVSASGKWFGLTATNDIMAIGGTFTSGDIYVMNGGTLKINSGASVTTSAVRLGGDFGNTGNQNQTLGGTLQFTNLTGGQSFGSVVNTVTGNTSGALLIDSLNTSNTNTISGNIFLDSNLRINQASGGTLSITNSTLDLKAQTLTLTGGTTANIGITGVIGNSVGSGQLVVGVNGTAGGPIVTLSNANTYTGDTFVRAGTLAFTSAGSAASSSIRFGSTSGTSVDANINLTTLTGSTTISSVINPVSTSGSGTLTVNSQNTSGTNTLSGHIALDRSMTITQAAGGTLNITQTKGGDNTTGNDIKGNTETFTPASGGTINHSGTIYNSTGTGTVVMNGAGTLVLTGANTYSGGTSVTAGTLLVTNTTGSGTGTTSVTVTNSGTTLAGGTTAGTGGISGAVNINPSANLSPGTSGDGVGTTAILKTGALTLVSGSNFKVDLNNTTAGTGYDQVSVTGTVNLGGTLASNLIVTAGAGLTVGNKFFIILNDGTDLVSGTFAQGATVTASNNGDIFTINYADNGDGGITPNDISLTLTAVPEPSTWLAGGLAFSALLFTQRRRILERLKLRKS